MVGLTAKELSPIPPATAVPPQLPVYQSVVYPPPGLFTEIVEDPPLHIVAGLAAIPVGVVGSEFTITVTLVQAETQPVVVFLVRA